MKLKFNTHTFLISATVILSLFFTFSLSHEAESQSASSFNYSFTRILTVGDRNNDVLMLQKLLNRDISTRIAATGLGSPGQETNYYGILTKQAVIRFQNRYPNEILVPGGLTAGNGRVGPLTLKKLNSLVTQINAHLAQNGAVNPYSNPQTPQIPFVSNSFLVSAQDKIDIHETDKKIDNLSAIVIQKINSSISSQTASPIDISGYSPSSISAVFLTKFSVLSAPAGVLIGLGGEGFDVNGPNSVYFGENYVVKNVRAETNKALAVNVPAIPPGKYDVVVKNALGMSNSFFFVVTTAGSPRVSVSQISPSIIKYGGQVTLTGSGFTPTNNTIYTSYGVMGNLSSSDGRTITITFRPEYLSEIAKSAASGGQYEVVVYLVNDNGVSSPSSFTMTF